MQLMLMQGRAVKAFILRSCTATECRHGVGSAAHGVLRFIDPLRALDGN